MTEALALRTRSEDLSSALPGLLARAEHLSNTVLLGDHGRRRAGLGDTFWQYRIAQNHDAARTIDWRRSARSDIAFVQDKEWQIAQSILLWVDPGASMRFSSTDKLQTKAEVAKTIGLATAILLIRGGERVGLTGLSHPPRRGTAQIEKIADALIDLQDVEYATPDLSGLVANARAVFISDFLSDITVIEEAVYKASDRGIRGILLQVLDPQEEAFPFKGRTVFESVAGTIRHETQKASDLRDRYLDRLARRKDELRRLANLSGWQFETHHTDRSSTNALLWLYTALEQGV